MRILMRNTVFKTAALAGLFLCMLAFAGAFSGVTTSVHAMHGFIHANDVGTDEAKLKEFVEAAVDAFYIDFLLKQKCDFTPLGYPPAVLEPLSTQIIKSQIPGFAPSITGSLDDYCQETMSFDQVFDRMEGDWNSGSIYIFVMNDQREMLFNGADQTREGTGLEALDRGDRDVAQSIIDEVETPNPSNPGIVQYCWDDPTVEGDNEDNPNSMTAPGFSWKVSYVVDPIASLELAPSSNIIFGSGIYPKTGTPLSGCEIVTDDEPTDPEPTDPEPTDPEPTDTEPTDPGMVTSVSGGGCAIAAGSDGTPTSNAFNLLLIVSALLFTVSFGNRAMGRRNRD